MAHEMYDADGDVSRFLQSPGRDAHLLDVPPPEPEVPLRRGWPILVPDAEAHRAMQMLKPAPVVGAQEPPAVLDVGQNQAPPPAALGFQGPPAVDVVGPHQQAPPPAFGLQEWNAGVERNPAAGFSQPPPAMDGVEPHPAQASGNEALKLGVQAGYPDPGFGFQDQIVDFGYQPAPAFGFPGSDQAAQIADVENQLAPAFVFQRGQIAGVEHHQHQAPFIGFQQGPSMDVEQRHLQAASMFGFQQGLPVNIEQQQLPQAPVFGFHSSTNGFEQHQQAPSFGFPQMRGMDDAAHHQAAAVMDAQQFQEPSMDVDVSHHHQGPSMDIDNSQGPYMGVNNHQAMSTAEATSWINEMLSQGLQVIELAPHHQVTDNHHATTMDNRQNHQSNQAPATDFETNSMPAQETSSWVDEMLAQGPRVVPSPASQRREQELDAALPRQGQAGNAGVDGAHNVVDVAPVVEDDDRVYIPFVHGELDCTKCRLERVVLHEIDGRKAKFALHSLEEGTLQHGILECMSAEAKGHFRTIDLLYVDLRNRTHEWVCNFIADNVKVLRKIKKGTLQDRCSASYRAAFGANISTAPLNDDSYSELELGMLNDIISTPDANGEGTEREASSQPILQDGRNSYNREHPSLPVTQAQQTTVVESRIKPTDFLGFNSDILESSQVKPYDPESSESVLMYPSMREKMKERELARLSNLTLEDALKMIEEAKKEIDKEPNLSSSVTFKLLCRKDKSYKRLYRRIIDLNKKILKIEAKARRAGTRSRLFEVMQKLVMHRQEKANYFEVIEFGLLDE